MRCCGAIHAGSANPEQRSIGLLSMDMSQISSQGRTVLDILRYVASKGEAITSDERGMAAVEFSLFAGILSLAVINAVDLSTYVYKRMELENATQMGAQAVWKACDTNHLPATTSCSGLTAAVTNAVQSTSLGSHVSLPSGSPSEGYYCLNSANALQYVSDVAKKPSNCAAAGMPNLQPADYIKVQTTFAYAPIFPGISITSAFVTPINKTAMMRLD